MKRGALGMHMNLFHRDYDLLVTPTLAVAAFDVGQDRRSRAALDRLDALHLPVQPHPAARGVHSLRLHQGRPPVGLQIVGPRYADALVLRAARAFESVRPFKLPDLARLAP